MRAEAYAHVLDAVRDRSLPTALIDLVAFDANIERFTAPARAAGKTLRVASKSIRCVDLIERVLTSSDVVQGVMAFHPREAAYLTERGIDDVLLAYPVARSVDAETLAATRVDASLSIVADDVLQLDLLAAAARAAGRTLAIVVDADMSLRPGAGVHLGVRRSPLTTVDAVVAFAQEVLRRPGLELAGVMGYEAQIAGLPDRPVPGATARDRFESAPKHLIRQVSRRTVARTRAAIRRAFSQAGLPLRIFNGGGTGSIRWTAREDAITEVTVGSGFMGSHLFDGYRELVPEPAAFFALGVSRRPAPGIVTCHGGGYIASGATGPDRSPRPVWPTGLVLTPMEGAGEVQTPLTGPGAVNLRVGDAVLFRHAKAGELSEHFERYLLVGERGVEAEAPTYRGDGQCF